WPRRSLATAGWRSSPRPPPATSPRPSASGSRRTRPSKWCGPPAP
ncbi:MAG: hypothetical protein AVDCRST_MAG50-2326, partial [uncultured Acidimicrobiales bacterium]